MHDQVFFLFLELLGVVCDKNSEMGEDFLVAWPAAAIGVVVTLEVTLVTSLNTGLSAVVFKTSDNNMAGFWGEASVVAIVSLTTEVEGSLSVTGLSLDSTIPRFERPTRLLILLMLP